MHIDQDDRRYFPAEIDTPHWLRMSDDAAISFELFLTEDEAGVTLAETEVPFELLNIL